jgi:hypothetical protein
MLCCIERSQKGIARSQMPKISTIAECFKASPVSSKKWFVGELTFSSLVKDIKMSENLGLNLVCAESKFAIKYLRDFKPENQKYVRVVIRGKLPVY